MLGSSGSDKDAGVTEISGPSDITASGVSQPSSASDIVEPSVTDASENKETGGTATTAEFTSDTSAGVVNKGQHQESLNTKMNRAWNTRNLFTGAESGFLPYLSHIQLEVLFWWSEIRLFEYKQNLRNKSQDENSFFDAKEWNETDESRAETSKYCYEFKNDAINKLLQCKKKSINKPGFVWRMIACLKMQRKPPYEIHSFPLYEAIVANGHKLIRIGQLSRETPVWSRSEPEFEMNHLTSMERKTKSLYAMSVQEVEEMRFKALSSVGIVFASYKMEYWYWELIEMFRK
jgi:hypothetical protein